MSDKPDKVTSFMDMVKGLDSSNEDQLVAVNKALTLALVQIVQDANKSLDEKVMEVIGTHKNVIQALKSDAETALEMKKIDLEDKRENRRIDIEERREARQAAVDTISLIRKIEREEYQETLDMLTGFWGFPTTKKRLQAKIISSSRAKEWEAKIMSSSSTPLLAEPKRPAEDE